MFPNIGNLLSGIMGGGRQAQAPARTGFLTYVGITDGDAAYDTQAEVIALVPAGNVFTKIWQKTVPAQQEISWGYGTPVMPENQGYMWFAILDAGTGFQEGVLRLAQQDANAIHTLVAIECPDRALHSVDSTSISTAALISRQEMTALPEKTDFPVVGEDSRIFIEYRTITDQAGADQAGFKIPVTIYQ